MHCSSNLELTVIVTDGSKEKKEFTSIVIEHVSIETEIVPIKN